MIPSIPESSHEMKDVAWLYGFRNKTFIQEVMARQREVSLLHAEDSFLALLNYSCGLRPVELYETIDTTTLTNKPADTRLGSFEQFRINERQFKCHQKVDYN